MTATLFPPKLTNTNTFYWQGGNVNFANERDKKLQDESTVRIITNSLFINSTASASVRRTDATYYPSTIRLTAMFTGYDLASTTFKWAYYNSTAADVWVDLTDEILGTATVDVSLAQFLSQVGTTAAGITYRCIINQPGKFTSMAFYTVTHSVNGASPPIVYLSKETIVLPADSAGAVTSYSNSGCTIQVMQNDNYLTASGTAGAPNSFFVTASGSNITAGTVSYSGTTCTIANASASVSDSMYITYTVTIRDADGNPSTNTIVRAQTVTKSTTGATGTPAKFVTLSTDTFVFSRVNSDAGSTYSPTSATLTVTPTGAAVSNYVWTNSVGTTVQSSTSTTHVVSSGSPSTYKVTATFTGGGSASDEVTLAQLTGGSDAYNAILTNENHSVVCESNGTGAVFSGASTNFLVYRGITQVTTGVTYSIAAGGNPDALGTTLSGSVLTVTAKGSWADADPLTSVTLQAVVNSVTLTKVFSLAKAFKGTTGTTGGGSGTFECFKWSQGAPGTPTQAATVTWGSPNSISAYPATWAASVSSPANGSYSLYKLTLQVTGAAGGGPTAVNWSSGQVTNARVPGAVRAFIVNTSNTAPIPNTGGTTTGYNPPYPNGSGLNLWSFSATSALNPTEYLYQVDGIYVPGGNIQWGNAYLSNLKVGQLSALSANLGVVAIDTTGNLHSGNKSYGAAEAGFFLGYSGGGYQLDIGNSTEYLRWDGSNLSMNGAINIGSISNMDPGGSGVHLYSDGLNIGNGVNNFRLYANGDVYTPSFTVIGGVANMKTGATITAPNIVTTTTINQSAVTTTKVANNAITDINGASQVTGVGSDIVVSLAVGGSSAESYKLFIIYTAVSGYTMVTNCYLNGGALLNDGVTTGGGQTTSKSYIVTVAGGATYEAGVSTSEASTTTLLMLAFKR